MAVSITRRELGAAILPGFAAGLLGLPFFDARAAEDVLNFQAVWLNDPEFLGYMIAIENGYYKAEGLTVNYSTGGPSLIPEGTLLSGKADVAMTSSLTTAQAIFQKGAPLVVIGMQYQKSPFGVISLADSNIKTMKDLAGKTIAVPTISENLVLAALKLSNLTARDVHIVPYVFDPSQLINGQVDAITDYVTLLPFLAEQQSGKKVNSFLFYDVGIPQSQDSLVVTKDTLKAKRSQLVKFLRASRKGWQENFVDPKKYPTLYNDTWFKGVGSTIEAGIYFNTIQLGLMQNPKGFFAMSEDDIKRNLDAFATLGVKSNASMFDMSLLAEA